MDYENDINMNDNLDENMIDDINNANDFDEENNEYNQLDEYNQNNQLNDYNQYELENNDEENGEEFNENDINMIIEENAQLKNEVNNILQKNNELEQYKKQYLKIKPALNNYIMNIKNLKNELNSANQKYFEVLKEVKLKNKIISDLQNGINIKDINFEKYKDIQNGNIILSIYNQIKNIQKEFFEEEEMKNENNELQNMEQNAQMELLTNNLNNFMEKLINYKYNKTKEIVNLNNIIQSNNNINIINDQYYIKISDIIKNLIFALPNNSFNSVKFPNFSKNDENEAKSKNILLTLKILSDYIISNHKNTIKNTNTNINLNEELNKRLKEMSELLVKSNENLSKARKDNNELKQKYNKLELNYNSLIKNEKENNNKSSSIDNDLKNLKDELNKKNQEIKSLEHMITRLTNKVDKNEENSIKKIGDNSIRDKIINEKNNNYYLQYNKFVKDEKNENNLKKFLDKFTNGEYGGLVKKKINIKSLKEQVDKLDKRINEELGNK